MSAFIDWIGTASVVIGTGLVVVGGVRALLAPMGRDPFEKLGGAFAGLLVAGLGLLLLSRSYVADYLSRITPIDPSTLTSIISSVALTIAVLALVMVMLGARRDQRKR